MARGHPDYFGQQQFPKYGTIETISPTTLNCPNAAQTSIFYKAAKGMIYGGFVELFLNTNDPTKCNLIMILDGIGYPMQTLAELLDRNMIIEPDTFQYLTKYNYETAYYCITFKRDCTFDLSIRVYVDNTTGALVTIEGKLLITKIE